MMLELNNLDSGYGKLAVLKDVSMHVETGEIVTIIGANGAGKTTLLHTICGLIKPTSGNIKFRNQSIIKLRPEKIVFSGCSLVPEGRQVFATMTVLENLLLGGYPIQKKEREPKEKQLTVIYNIFPILKDREKQLAGTLSGGEQQMLAMGRALMAKPALVMMDEPSTGLAPMVIKEIFRIITKLKKTGNTVLLVEQNAKAALAIADRGYVLETGKITLHGYADDLLKNQAIQQAYLGKQVDT
jgi:branched-chain amino acid transport system ATP-binding protein